MSNVVALQPQRALRDYTPSQLALIRRTVAADTTTDEFDMFVEVCRRVGLDPFRRQVYCLVYNKDDEKKRKVTFITGIDGFRAVAARNGDYRPDDAEPDFTIDQSLVSARNPRGLVKAVVKTFKRGGDGEWFPVVGVAYWSEFAPMKQDAEGGYDWVDTGEVWPDTGKPKKRKVPRGEVTEVPSGKWADMPFVMLAKCAEAQALRKGWPEDLSGIYSPEEMERPMLDVTPSAAVEQHNADKRLALVGAKEAIAILWQAGQPIELVPLGQMADRCMAFIRSLDSATGLDWWWSTNEASLREFWARSRTDALAVKEAREARAAELAKA